MFKIVLEIYHVLIKNFITINVKIKQYTYICHSTWQFLCALLHAFNSKLVSELYLNWWKFNLNIIKH